MSLEVYHAHQRTMRAFLESQRQVIARVLTLETAFESGEQGSPSTSPPARAIAASVPQPSGSGAIAPMGRFTIRARPSPITSVKSRLGGFLLVVPDCAGLVGPLSGLLAEYGAKLGVLPSSSLCHTQSLDTAVREIRKQMGPIAGVIFAQGVEQTEMPESLEEWRKINQFQAKGLFLLLQATARDLRELKGQVLTLSAMGGRFGRESGNWQSLPTSGAAVGLIKTAAIEWPEVTFKAIDFEDAAPDFLARAVLEELLSRDNAAEIGYLKKARHVFEELPTPLPLPALAQPTRAIEPDWIVFATGGARGITAQVLSEILLPGMTVHLAGRAAEPGAETGWSREAATKGELRKKFIEKAQADGKSITPILVEKEISRVLRDREILANLERFRGKAARVVYHSTDVRDEAAMGAIIDSIYEEHGRIDAVIHGAGIIEDKLLIDKSADSFHRVFDTKADSTYLLSRLLRPESLKLLVFFASVAGRTGNRGQCDYAAANELVNRFAWWLRNRWPHVRISALNWGPWESGMASEEINRQFRERGVIPIPPVEGRAFFKREILFGSSRDVEIVAGYFQAPEGKGAVPPRWPLLGGAGVQRAGEEAFVECALSVTDYPFLDDHRIDDKAVVPWAVAAELIAQVVQTAWPKWHVTEILNHQQLRGMIVEDDSILPVRVAATRKEGDETCLASAMITQTDRLRRPYYRASLLLRREPLDPPLAPAIPAAAPAQITSKVFYGQHTFLGPSFRFLHLVTGLDSSGVDATIFPDSQGWNWVENPWVFHAGVLDTAMQLGSFWTQSVLNSFALPVRATRIVRYGAYRIHREELRILTRIKSSTAQAVVFDFLVSDRSGQVLLRAESVEMAHSTSLLRLASQGPPV